MRRLFLQILLIGLPMLITIDGSAASQWMGTIRGGGELVLDGDVSGHMEEARLHWNLMVDQEGVFNGVLIILEKLNDGTRRNFHLNRRDLQTLSTSVPPGSFFDCNKRSVQVIGIKEDEKIVVTFHENPKAIQYVITDLSKKDGDEGYFISRIEVPVPLDGRMTLECEASEGFPEEQTPEDGWNETELRKIYLPVISTGILD